MSKPYRKTLRTAKKSYVTLKTTLQADTRAGESADSANSPAAAVLTTITRYAYLRGCYLGITFLTKLTERRVNGLGEIARRCT